MRKLVGIGLLVVVLVGCKPQAVVEEVNPMPTSMPTVVESAPVTKYEWEATEDGQTAFEVAQANADLEYTEYDFGVFVEGINGVKGNFEYFWALYVNGEKSQTGADQAVLQKGDVVMFVYEEIQ